nr:import component protein [Mucilaginibacter sp. L294]
MNNKTLSIVSYITPIGWLIAYFSGKDKADALLKYHLKQSLGLAIVSIALNIFLRFIISLVPALAFLGLIGLVIIIFWILGMINAANNALKPLPVFGKAFESSFSFID